MSSLETVLLGIKIHYLIKGALGTSPTNSLRKTLPSSPSPLSSPPSPLLFPSSKHQLPSSWHTQNTHKKKTKKMTFWKTFGFHNVSAIDTLLERENFTLEDLMEEEELLSECKGQNQKLLDFILQPETLSLLMDYLSNNPPSDVQKYPYLACEILCLDVWDICEVREGDSEGKNILMGFVFVLENWMSFQSSSSFLFISSFSQFKNDSTLPPSLPPSLFPPPLPILR